MKAEIHSFPAMYIIDEQAHIWKISSLLNSFQQPTFEEHVSRGERLPSEDGQFLHPEEGCV